LQGLIGRFRRGQSIEHSLVSCAHGVVCGIVIRDSAARIVGPTPSSVMWQVHELDARDGGTFESHSHPTRPRGVGKTIPDTVGRQHLQRALGFWRTSGAPAGTGLSTAASREKRRNHAMV
jgi:hypothetical protein